MTATSETFKAGSIDNAWKVTTMMSVQNAPQSAPERHFDIFADLYPNHCTPQFTPEIDRLVTAVERLSCCTVCSERLMTWLVEGRFGPDYQVALEKIVLALATQHEEAQP